jgi:EAL domain-containing protein (putative c-di-GMP-specific phosphodiesterase class I)
MPDGGSAPAGGMFDPLRAGPDADGTDAHVRRMLHIVRTHLGMDVAFVSEFFDGRRVFRQVDSGGAGPVVEGGSDLLEDSYCQRVADGRLPQLMVDACGNEEALTLPATRELPVGAHISVPLRMPDGHVFGTFCCFSHAPDLSLTQRDLAIMEAFAAIVAEHLHDDLERERDISLVRDRIAFCIANAAFHVRYQPIYRLQDGSVAAFESLARFSGEPYRSPDKWFDDAARVGCGAELELAVARKAMEALASFPPDILLTVNFSPETILSEACASFLRTLPLDRIVVEVTEHAVVANYAELSSKLQPFRERGLRLAVDDAGAGHSSFRHVLDLRPDTIKLDMSLTRNIDRDNGRQALAGALAMFGRAMGSQIVAEGVETEAELEALRRVGVTKVQGYLTGKPMPLGDALTLPGLASQTLMRRRRI